MDEGTGQIRQDVSDIIKTRAAMAEKLQRLEDRIQDTVEGAKAAVLDVVENVKDTAEDLVDRTKRTFDPLYQTEQHPLVMIVAAAAGLLVAATLALWAHYGTAVFYEMILAGIALCF
jgi:CHASE3 domain sensor protein